MNLLKNKLIKRGLALLTVGAVGYFFYVSLNGNWQKVQEINLSFGPLPILAIALFTLAVLVSGYLWGMMLDELTRKDNRSVHRAEAIRVHIASWLLKYIPGQAGSAVNKVLWATNNGYSKKLVLISFVYENIFLQVASFVLAVPLLIAVAGGGVFFQNWTYLLLTLLTLAAAAVVINARSIHFIMNLIFTKLIKQPVSSTFFLSTQKSVKLQAYYLLPRIINGLGFAAVVTSFTSVSAEAYVALSAAYVLAGAIGILAVFVPSGIGVREAVLVVFATQFIPVEQAIVAAIIARLYSTLADAVLAIGYGLLSLRKNKEIAS